MVNYRDYIYDIGSNSKYNLYYKTYNQLIFIIIE